MRIVVKVSQITSSSSTEMPAILGVNLIQFAIMIVFILILNFHKFVNILKSN